jgi:hypothetical protein
VDGKCRIVKERFKSSSWRKHTLTALSSSYFSRCWSGIGFVISIKARDNSRGLRSGKSIMAVLPLPTPLSDRAPTSNAPNSPQIPPRAQAGPLVATTLSMTVKRDALTVQILPSPRTPPGPTFGPDADPALYWPKAYDSSPFNILPHADRYASPTNSHELIRAEIRKPLVRCQ